MAGSSSGWCKSTKGAKARVFVSSAAIRARFPYASVADTKARLRDSGYGGLAHMVEELSEQSQQPAGQAKARPVTNPVSPLVPQRGLSDYQEREFDIRASIPKYLKDPSSYDYIPGLSKPIEANAKDVIDTALHSMREVIAGSDVAMMVPNAVLAKILETGFKNQHATKTSKGTLDRAMRQRMEKKMFGIEGGSSPDAYPIYGLLTPKHDMGQNEGTSSYGPIKVVFKESVRARTTVTTGDSLDVASYLPQPLDSAGLPSIGAGFNVLRMFANAGRSIGERMKAMRYFEVQIHGPTTAADIAKVVFTEQSKPTKAVLARLKEMGIPYIIEKL